MHGRLTSLTTGAALLLATFGLTLLSRMYAPDGTQAAPFWPMAGIALAAVVARHYLFVLFPLAGVLVWSANQNNLVSEHLLVLMGLISPLVGGIALKSKLIDTDSFSWSPLLRFYIVGLVLLAGLSSAIWSYASQALGLYTNYQYIFVWLTFWLSEAVGMLLFFPITLAALKAPSFNIISRSFTLTFGLLTVLFGTAYLSQNLLTLECLILTVLVVAIYSLNEKNTHSFLFISTLWFLVTLTFGGGSQLPGLSENNPSLFEELTLLSTTCIVLFHIIHSFSKERENLIKGLRHRAEHDELTGLLNERGFQKAIEKRDATAKHLCAMISLRHSDDTLENLGYNRFAELMNEIAERTSTYFRRETRVALISGSRVAAMIKLSASDNPEELLEGLSRVVQDNRLQIVSTLYVAEVAVGGLIIEDTPPGDLLALLSSATHYASGLNGKRYYLAEHEDLALKEQVSAFQDFQRFKALLNKGHLVLYGQKICPAHGRSTQGKIEILSRLTHSDGTLISPLEFIRSFETYQYAVEFDRKVLTTAFASIAAINRKDIRFNINVSAVTLAEENMAHMILELLSFYEISTSQIAIEITETQALEQSPATQTNIATLRSEGIAVGIDDFGTGFASFSLLSETPIDFLKIDGCFVKGMLSDNVKQQMVQSIASVAKAKSLETVAEFVEDADTTDFLAHCGVDFVQGFGIGKPMPLKDCVKSLDADAKWSDGNIA